MVIGITGGIGSGKSTICRALGAMGFTIYDCDFWASFLMNSDASVINQIKSHFSDQIYSADGVLDRRLLASKVFNDTAQLKILESIVHTALFTHLEGFISQNRDKIVIVESAILFESGFNKIIDKVITISAPESLRIDRAMSRDCATRAQIKERVAKQMSDAQREKLADFTIICDDYRSVIVPILDIIDTKF
ncbi:MAG: dephospho-CoA kinase [Rikenellaceae bacterium]